MTTEESAEVREATDPPGTFAEVGKKPCHVERRGSTLQRSITRIRGILWGLIPREKLS